MGAKLVEFPELGHAPQMHDPAAFHKALLGRARRHAALERGQLNDQRHAARHHESGEREPQAVIAQRPRRAPRRPA